MKKFLFFWAIALGSLCAQAAVYYDIEIQYSADPTSGLNVDTFYCTYADADHTMVEIVGIRSAYTDSTLTIPDALEVAGTPAPLAVVGIGEALFSEREFMRPRIKKVTLPLNLTSIGNLAFDSCFNLETYEIGPSNSYKAIDGVLYSTDETELVKCPQGKQGAFSLPEKVEKIATYAFHRCEKLTAVKWEKSVNNIDARAFANARNLVHVYSGANTPPALKDTTVFEGISNKAVLHVPTNYVDRYKAINGYANYFQSIQGLSEPAEVTGNSVVLKWVPDSAVTKYTIRVYEEDELFATYIVDGTGKIVSQTPAPRMLVLRTDSAVSTTEYYTLTLGNLQSNTSYSYEITGVNDSEEPVYEEKGTFRTTGGNEGLVPTEEETRPATRKVLRNGQIIILRGPHIYSLQGQKQ